MVSPNDGSEVLKSYQALLITLGEFETSVAQKDVSDVEILVAACQKFLDAGHNFDDRAHRESLNGSAVPHVLTPAQLEHLSTRIRTVINTTLQIQESVRQEAQRLSTGRQGIRGYRTLQSDARERFVSILG